MMKVTAYVYSLNSMKIIAEVTGYQTEVEEYIENEWDNETVGMTYSPAFGFSGGLVDTNDKEIIEL